MNNYEIISLILNIALVLIGIITIFVVIRIYQQQKYDARILQEKQLEETERLQKELRRREIQPDLIDGSSGTSGTEFYSNFYFKNNDAKDIYLADINIDDNILLLRMDKFRSITKGREFPVRGSRLTDYSKLEKYKYYYSIYFSDIDGNKYKAEVENTGMSATVLKNILL
jgi:hypothetical protein